MTQYSVHCDCETVEITMNDRPKVHAFCHCEDCRELLQVPYHSVLAWESGQVGFSKGQKDVVEYQHPSKNMKRIFCKHCGDVLYNTNAMGWKIVSQLMFRKCNGPEFPDGFASNAHFFYDRRIVDVDDVLPKK